MAINDKHSQKWISLDNGPPLDGPLMKRWNPWSWPSSQGDRTQQSTKHIVYWHDPAAPWTTPRRPYKDMKIEIDYQMSEDKCRETIT